MRGTLIQYIFERAQTGHLCQRDEYRLSGADRVTGVDALHSPVTTGFAYAGTLLLVAALPPAPHGASSPSIKGNELDGRHQYQVPPTPSHPLSSQMSLDLIRYAQSFSARPLTVADALGLQEFEPRARFEVSYLCDLSYDDAIKCLIAIHLHRKRPVQARARSGQLPS